MSSEVPGSILQINSQQWLAWKPGATILCLTIIWGQTAFLKGFCRLLPLSTINISIPLAKPSAKELMFFNCGVGRDSWESLGLQGDPRRSNWFRKSVLNIHWKDWCRSWISNPWATWYKELTHLKRPWCWERLKAGGEGGYRDEMAGWHHWLNGHEFE